jgi:superoxide reductase
MANRRDFLKTSMLVTAALAAGKVSPVFAGGNSLPAGLIYTAANQGKWAGKAKSHAPVVTVVGDKYTVVTNHPMTEPHFIVRHTLVAADGEVLGENTFSSADAKAVSEFKVAAGKKVRYATSFCNKHDFWVTEL